ncbi:nickel-dependent lactate racemase [Carboxydochorda subterranea]|uniref:Nickel-dependent lactate racemase n=1 Tax=Carboxydichorda subterranea TaxID=3109565 RepID=A0ABZ1BWZ6_9FIRM|nr:nickel-dependent lactate racemase [Limnochorda sp. L945t]WRP17204.1 nickel-dependent lactate racemase [Limnochorda sp. L945t]
MAMRVDFPYGQGHVTAELPDDTTVIEPHPQPGLEDERAAFVSALRAPIGSAPLRQLVGPDDRVVIVIADGTRAAPSERMVPWILEELDAVPRDRVTVLVGTGTHRPNTPAELERMLGRRLLQEVRVVNHSAYDDAGLVHLGEVPGGGPVWLNRHYVEASVRIVTGFIEPHFFAGFSGGPKGVAPGVAGLETILWLHGARLIGDPRATWGVLDGNPVHEAIRAAVKLAPPHFLANVTLNERRQITGVFAGNYLEAHRAGCEACRRASTRAVDRWFDVVVTSNSGFPLDQNLYQTVKGLSAAARIVRPGGAIVAVSECADGVPSHGRFGELLSRGRGPRDWLRMVEEPGFRSLDQWQVQILAMVLERARVYLLSSLPPATVEAAGLVPVTGVEEALDAEAHRSGAPRPLAVAALPMGPLTIPYVRI